MAESTLEKQKKHIVILGAGYAGIHAYKTLEKYALKTDDVHIDIISNTDDMLFATMLYEVASGSLSPNHIKQPIRNIIDPSCADFICGIVQKVALDTQTVTYTWDGGISTMSYDYLVVALGSETDPHGVPGALKNAYPLKTLLDARAIKESVIDGFEQAVYTDNEDEKRRLERTIIIGGGPTGITLAGKLADLLRTDLQRAFPTSYIYSSIVVLEPGKRILERLPKKLSFLAEKELVHKQCVTIKHGTYVTEVRNGSVILSTDDILEAHTIVWTAGVRARTIVFEGKYPVSLDEKSRRIEVLPTLALPNYPQVFVAGDQAYIKRENDVVYPMKAQLAVKEGRGVARNIIALLRGRAPQSVDIKDQGTVVSLGKRRSVAYAWGIIWGGFFATFMYRALHLANAIGVRVKIRAALDWLLHLLVPRDISRT